MEGKGHGPAKAHGALHSRARRARREGWGWAVPSCETPSCPPSPAPGLAVEILRGACKEQIHMKFILPCTASMCRVKASQAPAAKIAGLPIRSWWEGTLKATPALQPHASPLPHNHLCPCKVHQVTTNTLPHTQPTLSARMRRHCAAPRAPSPRPPRPRRPPHPRPPPPLSFRRSRQTRAAAVRPRRKPMKTCDWRVVGRFGMQSDMVDRLMPGDSGPHRKACN
jgi:hypothetical protein